MIKSLAALLALAASVLAQSPSDLPAYQAGVPVTGVIKITTGSYGKGLVANWEAGFKKHHPGATFVFDFGLAGSGGIPASLYDARHADLGLMGRELSPAECLEFWRNSKADPLLVTTATGSYDSIDKTMPMIVIVSRDNPLTQLTMKQLDGIFGEGRDGGYEGQYWRTDRTRPKSENIRTWGELGLTGEWKDKPIETYGYDVQRDNFAQFFSQRVLNGGDKWAPSLHEFGFSIKNGEMGLNGAPHKAGSAPMVEAVGKDKFGIGYCTVRDESPSVKVIALAQTSAGPYLLPSKENVSARTYPLTRSIYWVVARKPGQPTDPKVREFLRYVLSSEGQADVAREGSYLPLTADAATAEAKKLD